MNIKRHEREMSLHERGMSLHFVWETGEQSNTYLIHIKLKGLNLHKLNVRFAPKNADCV